MQLLLFSKVYAWVGVEINTAELIAATAEVDSVLYEVTNFLNNLHNPTISFLLHIVRLVQFIIINYNYFQTCTFI